MKKLIQSIFTVAFALATAMTFSSCEDVPAPYSIPDDPSSPDTPSTEVEATGSGTQTDPYNVAAAVKYIENGGSEETEVYVKGIVVSVKSGSYDSSYGSLKYYISDDGTATNQFYVYNGYYGPNRTKFSGEDALKAGDVVVICGKLVEYSGTKEFTTGNYLVELNGKSTTGSEPETPSTDVATGDGTVDNPYNYVAATNLASSLSDNGKSEEVYIKGKVSSIKEEYNANYGNGTFYITDSGSSNDNQFYIYRAYYLENKKFTDGNTQIKVGDEVVICGKVTKYVSSYGTTLETVQGSAYLYSLNGKTTDDGTTEPGVPSTPATTGLITNGDFESWTNGLPTNWKSSSKASSATLTQSTDARSGSYSVNVKGDSSSNKRLAYKETKLKAGTYTFSYYAKSTTTNPSQTRGGYVPVVDGTATSTGYKYNTSWTTLNNTSWTLCSYEFTLDAETTVCLLVMNPKTSNYSTAQDILVDDAILTTTNGGLAE